MCSLFGLGVGVEIWASTGIDLMPTLLDLGIGLSPLSSALTPAGSFMMRSRKVTIAL